MLQVPNTLSICGAVLICSCTFLLGVFTRKKEPGQAQERTPAATDATEAGEIAAERAELQALLGDESKSEAAQNGRNESV